MWEDGKLENKIIIKMPFKPVNTCEVQLYCHENSLEIWGKTTQTEQMEQAQKYYSMVSTRSLALVQDGSAQFGMVNLTSAGTTHRASSIPQHTVVDLHLKDKGRSFKGSYVHILDREDNGLTGVSGNNPC